MENPAEGDNENDSKPPDISTNEISSKEIFYEEQLEQLVSEVLGITDPNTVKDTQIQTEDVNKVDGTTISNRYLRFLALEANPSATNVSSENNVPSINFAALGITDPQVKLFWDGKYEGQLKDDKREGYGIMSYFTGERYEGQWSGDKWNGEGTISYLMFNKTFY